ncbi:hypothetical protein FGO68_gene9000 [Halteria grandinella]|uniref:Uncharacterized protein n=1 Tax=Halteria grandinella TaxID=5974 RepID=A0A8J8NDH9_HALGN|nr:hypothetical protein FGO68_gene9000 [Halteria grandinella]
MRNILKYLAFILDYKLHWPNPASERILYCVIVYYAPLHAPMLVSGPIIEVRICRFMLEECCEAEIEQHTFED